MNLYHYRHRQRNDSPLPGPTIYRLASERRYGEIPAHVRVNPQDIYWADRYGSTALHVLCCSRQSGDPLVLRAIDSIIQLDPLLVGRPNEASWTPLHLACEKRLLWRTDVSTSDLVVRLVLACPSAVSVRLQAGYKARTPFHIACETNATTLVLQTMLHADPSLARQGCHHSERPSETPIDMLWSAIRKEQPSVHLGDSLVKMELLMRAAFRGTIVEEEGSTVSQRSFPLMCAVCSIRCPRDYISQILSIRRNEVSMRDQKTGYLPLHYAIMSAEEDDMTSYTSFLIDQLIEVYPEAAQIPFRPGSNVLPLHVLVADRGMTWHKGGVKKVVQASIDALTIADPRSRLVPALESASNADKSRLHLSTTYELLRLAPQVLQTNFFQSQYDLSFLTKF